MEFVTYNNLYQRSFYKQKSIKIQENKNNECRQNCNAKESGLFIILIIYSGFDLWREFKYDYFATMNGISLNTTRKRTSTSQAF